MNALLFLGNLGMTELLLMLFVFAAIVVGVFLAINLSQNNRRK